MTEKITRREFMVRSAASAAAGAGRRSRRTPPTSSPTPRRQLKWSKAPCRFCGVGCGVNVAVKDGQVVATHGDPQAEVNRGVNCVKGYFLSKIMYGEDRLTRPLLRMKNGRYDKEGEFPPVTWDQAFDVMAEKWKAALKAKGPTAVGMFGSGQSTIWEGYAAVKLMKAGFRSNNIDPNARHCMAGAAVGFMRTFGIDEPMGCYDDIEHADAFVLWGSNMAEMHPVLWQRIAERRLGHPHARVAVLSTFEHRSYDLADLPLTFRPQTDLAILNYIANYIIQNKAREPRLRREARRLPRGQRRHRLRPARRSTQLQKKAKNAADAGGSKPIAFDEFASSSPSTTSNYVSKLSGVPPERLRRLAQLYADPEDEGHVVLDHGLQPAHARRLGEPPRLQHAPADRQDLHAGQQPVLAHRPALGVRHRARSRHVLAPAAGRHGRHRTRSTARWPRRSGSCRRERSPTKPGFHAVLQSRMLKDGKLNVRMRVADPTTTSRRSAANINARRLPGIATGEAASIDIRLYPTVTTRPPTSSCPPRCRSRKRAPTATPSGAPILARARRRAGEARSNLWQLIEFPSGSGSKR